MDFDEIKTLTDLMVDNDLTEIMIRDGEKRIVIRRGATNSIHHSDVPVATAPPPWAPGSAASKVADAASAPQEEATGVAAIKSPMVGTYYATPAPDAAPFVKVGDHVGPETVVGVIEAMKVFNEIKADVTGVIESLEVASGAPVEFGQVLMKVRTT